ncbi:MAG: glycosyltransferase family 4 protein [Thiobacillus sp.]|nr:glycosyltransferase family 4 protein [Thiobacillus sp.]
MSHSFSLRVGIDFHVVDGKFQGSRTHVLELFAEVIRQSPDIQFYLLLDNPDELINISPVFSFFNVVRVRMPHTNPVARLIKQLPDMQKKYSLDVIHTQYILPIFFDCKGMVTIHDVLFESHPQFFQYFFRLRSMIFMRYSAKKAAHIFTVSEYSRDEIARRYDVTADKITVIPNAADPNRFFPGDAGYEHVMARGLSPRNYILSVGRLEPRKNHAMLVRAYKQLGNNAPPLVIVGQRDFSYGELFKEVSRLDLSGQVLIFEDADDRELPALYRNALLFVYPALAEGFGMPPLEALASGVPVVCSNSTSMPEVVGNAGLLVEPNDESALTEAMRKVLGNPSLALRLVSQGLLQSKQFSWQESAHRVRKQYLTQIGGGAL